MKVHVFNQQSTLKFSVENVPAIVEAVISLEGKSCDEVAIHFVKQSVIAKLHNQFFDDPSPTDCISFPMDHPDTGDAYVMLGEVFVCPKTAVEYAKKHDLNVYHEVTLYVVHGLLHLMGYDDMDVKSRQKMRSAEKRQMRNLKKIGLIT